MRSACRSAGKREAGHAALDLMDEHLDSRDWFVADQFSLADICLFAYTHVADEADFDLEAYPEIVRWMERIMTDARACGTGRLRLRLP